MANKFKRYNKYLVLKISDLEQYLSREDHKMLALIVEKVRQNRILKGKKIHQYIVVNQELPYAEQVWKLIQDYWEKENK